MQFPDLKKPVQILFAILLVPGFSFSQQLRFSLSTDLSFQHNFKKEQRFTVIGNSTQAQFHFTPKDGLYIAFAYYSNGNFKNDLTAVAKTGATSPQQIRYLNRANMRLKQFSVGWKKYLKGASDAETSWSLYTYAGFGLLLGRVDNRHSEPIDTAAYDVPVLSGRNNFKRLPIEAGLGAEKYIGGDIFVFADARIWIPTDGYPSRYIYINDRAPWAGMLGVGLRVMF